jgi:3-oxoacyl-[acyl-carrier protein] reductase
MDLGLQGKRAVVTGASRGIGRAIAERLAAEGAMLSICARNDAGLQETARHLRRHGGKVVATAVDVSEGDPFRAWITSTAEELGGIDIVVFNPSAGGGPSEEGWHRMFNTDVLGAVRSVETALPFLERAEKGSIVFIGTTAAVEQFGLASAAYSSLKAALIAYANDISQRHGKAGVRCNVVSPGPILIEGGGWDRVRQGKPELFGSMVDQVALKRMGTADEVANAVAFLASPAAAFITGAHLLVDGGVTKRVNF